MAKQPNIVRREKTEPAAELSEALHPVLARIYASRGIHHLQELDYSIQSLTPFHQLMGIAQAVDLLVEVLQQQQAITIVGDFDADGATSTALAIRCLRDMGHHKVDFLVPNRFQYGYGLTTPISQKVAEQGGELLITVDNGIASIEGVAAARTLGMRVLITDHHLPGETLPAADAIVNPNQPGDEFPHKSLAGVGVVFYLMLALRTRLREMDWFTQQGIQDPNLARYLDLVALGTVADVVPLEHNNRILVEQGLRRIRAGQCCPGIRALCQIGKRELERLTSQDLGFALGPRLNAAGRLEDMSIGIRCLLTDSEAEAQNLAVELDSLNRMRQEIEQEMKEQAFALLNELPLDEAGEWPAAVCIYHEEWHEGVIGILASRIKERIHRPVIAFAQGENGQLKGSARSIPGLHIRDALAVVATQHPDILTRFGGHAMAAGMSLQPEHLEAFREAFIEVVDQQLASEDRQASLHVDGELNFSNVDLSLAEQLRTGGPWGQGFPAPLFTGKFEVVQQRIVGERHLKFTLRSPQGQTIDAIAFHLDDEQLQTNYQRIEAVYRLDINRFRGNQSLQVMLEWFGII